MTIPQFKNTEEALAFGRTATPKQKAMLYKLRQLTLHRAKEAMARGGEHQRVINLAVKAQFYRESLEANKEKC